MADGARSARQARGLSPHGLAMLTLPQPHRAAYLPAVVVLDGRAEAAGPHRAARGARPLPPGLAAPLCDPVARRGARLEHLAPDLVGAPAPGLGMSRRP